MATVKDIILHVLKLLELTSFTDFPSCLVTSREDLHEEEKLAPMAAACAFEAGRAAFSPSVTGDFLNNLGMQGGDNH